MLAAPPGSCIWRWLVAWRLEHRTFYKVHSTNKTWSSMLASADDGREGTHDDESCQPDLAADFPCQSCGQGWMQGQEWP